MTKSHSIAITALIDELDETLFEASHLAHTAREAMNAAQQNLAMGTLLPVLEQLESGTALLRASLALHQRRCT